MLTTFDVDVVVLVVEVDTTGLPLAVFGCTICTGLLCGFCDKGSNFGNGFTTEAFFIRATSAAVVVEALGFLTGFFLGTAPVEVVVVVVVVVDEFPCANLLSCLAAFD